MRFSEFMMEEWSIDCLCNIALPVTKKDNRDSINIVMTLSSEYGLVAQNDYFGKKIAGSDHERYIQIQPNDFVYNDRTTLLYPYGTIKRNSLNINGIVSPIYKCFRFKEKQYPVFWQYYFESHCHEHELKKFINEGARVGRFNISINQFLQIFVFLPRLQEQQKIADCLSSLDELIDAHEQKCEALKQHKKGLMQRLFPAEGETTPRWRFPEFRDAGEWGFRSLGAMTTKIGSGVTTRGGDKNYLSAGIPFVRSQNVGWGTLLLNDIVFISDKIHKTFLATELQFGDVLINITGASIGRCAIVNSQISGGNVNQHVCIIRVKKNELINSFLMQYLISAQGQAQIDSFQAGGNRQGLNFAQVASFSIPSPSPFEQQKIADCLSSLDERIEAQEAKTAALREHKKGLMQRLFPRCL